MLATGWQSLSSILPLRARPAAPVGSDISASAATRHEFNHPQLTFHFDKQAELGLSLDRQKAFVANFYQEMERLKQWAATQRWAACEPAHLDIAISEKFRISKSLVPAWYGHLGHMEFPAWRVIAGEAAIAHELVHVFFPNANRSLAEGLAVYLQAKVGGNPAFPNFARPLHEVARERLLAMAAECAHEQSPAVDQIRLADLDQIATPAPLELKVAQLFYGEERRGQAHIYPLVGSFVQFLIENRGLDRFRTLYARTPLVPLQQDAGPPGRWIEIYGVSLTDLEREWKSVIDTERVTQPEFNREPGNA